MATEKRRNIMPDNVRRAIRHAGRKGKKRVSIEVGTGKKRRTLEFSLYVDKPRKQVVFQEKSGFPVGRLDLER